MAILSSLRNQKGSPTTYKKNSKSLTRRRVLGVKWEYEHECKSFLPLTNHSWKHKQIYCHCGWNNKQILAGPAALRFLALSVHLYPRSWISHQTPLWPEYHGQGGMQSHSPAEPHRTPWKTPHTATGDGHTHRRWAEVYKSKYSKFQLDTALKSLKFLWRKKIPQNSQRKITKATRKTPSFWLST